MLAHGEMAGRKRDGDERKPGVRCGKLPKSKISLYVIMLKRACKLWKHSFSNSKSSWSGTYLFICLFVCLSTHSPSHVCERIWTLIKGKHPPENTLIHPAEFHSPFRRLSFMCSSFVVVVVVVVVVVLGCQTLRVRRLSDRPHVESEQSLSSSSFNVKHLPCIIQPFLFNDKNV